jgi:hypothetical protein
LLFGGEVLRQRFPTHFTSPALTHYAMVLWLNVDCGSMFWLYVVDLASEVAECDSEFVPQHEIKALMRAG